MPKKRIEIKLDFEESTKTTGKYLVFDIETTGLPINRYAPSNDFKNWPYVVQIAWLLFDDEGKLIEHKNFYLKQPVEIPADATNIHGITTAMMLEQGIEPSNVYANFKKAIDNTEYLISHNIDFDIPIVHCDFLRNGMQWDFPNNRMFCTMKTGTNFCKIPQSNGEYKWPTLTELYQKCFYPGYSMRIYSDATSTSNVHGANIDAAMVAQCFFKLKELGFFEGLKTNITAKHLSAEQIEDNFENLHKFRESIGYTRSDDLRYIAEIKHLGLGTSRVLKDEFKWRLDNTVEAQFKKWDERWAKLCDKKKSQADKEAGLNIAQERTRDAQEKQKQIEDLLIYALNIDSTVNWDSLKDTKEFKVPNPKYILERRLAVIVPPAPPTYRELPKEPYKGLYEPELSLVDKIFKSPKEKKLKQAETLYQEAMDAWKKLIDETNSFNSNLKEQYEQKLKEFEEQKQTVNKRFDALEKDWEKEKEAFYNNQKAYNDKIEKLKDNYLQKNVEAIIQYCEMVLNNSPYPETFPKDFDLDYNSDRRLLIVEYVLPAPDDLPTLTDVKYVATKKESKESFLSEKQLSEIYDSAIYKITLRTLHELFGADKADALEEIILNGWVNAINKATGKKVSNCIVTIQARKAEFNEIDLSNVDPKICFKNLKGIGSSKLSSMTALQPFARINDNDQRFISSHEGANQLSEVEKNGRYFKMRKSKNIYKV
jgi:restriction system protein